eukprot:Opistho-2@96005
MLWNVIFPILNGTWATPCSSTGTGCRRSKGVRESVTDAFFTAGDGTSTLPRGENGMEASFARIAASEWRGVVCSGWALSSPSALSIHEFSGFIVCARGCGGCGDGMCVRARFVARPSSSMIDAPLSATETGVESPPTAKDSRFRFGACGAGIESPSRMAENLASSCSASPHSTVTCITTAPGARCGAWGSTDPLSPLTRRTEVGNPPDSREPSYIAVAIAAFMRGRRMWRSSVSRERPWTTTKTEHDRMPRTPDNTVAAAASRATTSAPFTGSSETKAIAGYGVDSSGLMPLADSDSETVVAVDAENRRIDENAPLS